MLLGGALKFHAAPLKDKFCMTFVRCLGILRRAKRRLNLKFTRCFGAVKFHAKILLAKLQNSCAKFRLKILPAEF